LAIRRNKNVLSIHARRMMIMFMMMESCLWKVAYMPSLW